MSDDKGGSDLDVFEGLRKKQQPTAIPGLTPPPQNQPRQRGNTLLGGLGGLPPPPTTVPGGAAAPLPPPMPPPTATPLPPPVGAGPAAAPLPPVTPPPARAPTGSLPPVTPPPARPPTATPLPPPPGAAAAPLPPVVPPPARPPAKTAEEAPKQRAKGGPSVDMDWDDEEESTHVYDKATTDPVGPTGPRPAAGNRSAIPGSAAALLASSGGAAAPAARAPTPAPPPPAPHSAPPPAAAAQPAASPPSRRSEEATAVRPRPVVQTGGGSKAGIVLGGLALVAVLGMGVFLLLPKKGDLKIDVKTPPGVTIAKAEVFVDGQKKCDTVPCTVRDLEAGSKAVKVIAPELPPQDATGVVEGNKESLVLVDFSSAPAAATKPPSSSITGFKAASSQSGVKVFVDGAEKGTLPLELPLPPGSHKIRFEAGDRYEKREQTVEIAQGQLNDLGSVALKVVKGQVTLELATDGAAVTLVNAKNSEKRLPDALWKTPPVKLDIDPSEGWKVVAKKKGLDDFTQALTFEDGQAEKTIRIQLNETGKEPVATAPTTPAPGPGPAPGPAPGPTAKPETTAQAPASGAATLNINSIPVSKVVLDGRPLGSTPKVGVSVPPGSHTVTFIHPEKGKKSVTVTVKAGETKTAAVKF